MVTDAAHLDIGEHPGEVLIILPWRIKYCKASHENRDMPGSILHKGLSARPSRGENDHGGRRSGGYRSRSDVLFTRPHSRRVRHDSLGRTTREISVRATAQGQGSTAIGGRVIKSIEAPRRQGTAPCTAGWILHVRVAVNSIRMG